MSERLTLGLLCHWKASNYSIHWPNVLLYLLVCREFRHEFTLSLRLREGVRRRHVRRPPDRHALRPAAEPGHLLVGRKRLCPVHHSPAHRGEREQGILRLLRVQQQVRQPSVYLVLLDAVSLEFIGKNDGEIIFVVQNVIKRF
ncbi:hypothetical protein CEXT_275032 [Caerostris extrusa]|uniref:Uncharacterized protein n=1 Tax=Caerostris extrusa TaxID=172846 RepID=A0AAV4UX38_CAEEX|nr:hypothetical protein CEXT_275032 [Caerostris extrusa]